MNMITNIINRKVKAHENITTSAGTFKYYKISKNVKSKMSFVKVQLHNITWIVRDIGTIHTESYNKKWKIEYRNRVGEKYSVNL